MANKKINQLVSKTAILSTDIFGIGDATTGQLFKKTIAELQAAIGGAVISVNGLVGTVVLDTDDIQELASPTNKYFTDARARGAISLTVTGNSGASTYSSGTGVLNVPTYTLAGLGGITASFLSGTSGISYNSTTGVITYSGTVYTDASIRALISASTGLSYNSTTGVFSNTITQYTDALARASISAGTGIVYSSTTGIIASTITQYTDALARASISAGAGISYASGTGIIASTITQYTDALARAAHSLTTTGNSGASTYNSTTGVLNIPNYTLVGLGGITSTFLSGGSGISYSSTTGIISYTGNIYTDASIRALFSGGTGITYNSSTGAISYSGTVYTDSSVRALISMTTTGTSGASTYNNTTGVINVPNYTLAGLGGISLNSLSGGTGITYNSTTGAISYSGTVYTDASIRGLFSASGSVSYNSTTGVVSLTGGNLTEATSSVLTITGGTGAVIGGGTSIQVKQATTSISGFLSSTDWTTFNNKQATISLTTTGTSGAATFSANTLNIPNYGSALSGYLPLTGGTLTGALSGTSATFTSSVTGLKYIANSQATYASMTYEETIKYASSPAGIWFGNSFNSNNNVALQLRTSNDGTSVQALTIASTGAATFSTSVSISGLNLTSTYASKLGLYNAAASANIELGTNTSTNGAIVSRLTSYNTNNGNSGNEGSTSFMGIVSLETQLQGTNGGNFILKTKGDGGVLDTRLTIASTGAATFSSSVTARQGIINGLGGARNQMLTLTSGGTSDEGLFITTTGSGNDFYAIKVATGGNANAFALTNGGNVGIGTTAPSYLLDVRAVGFGIQHYGNSTNILRTYAGSGYQIIEATNSGVASQFGYEAGAYFVETAATRRMHITTAGNIGIGTSSPNDYGSTTVTIASTSGSNNAALVLRNSTSGLRGHLYTDGANATIVLGSATNHAVTFVSNDIERGRVTNGGNWLLGTSSDNGERLYVSGAIRATGTITANSDITLKKNLLKIENALEKVEQINGYTYELKEDDSKRHAGVIAQEIQGVLPEIVNKGNDGILGVEYGNISALLIEAIKEQQTQINELKALLNK